MTQENVLSRAVEFAQTLVRVPSVSGTPATHDVIRAVEEILSRFSRSTSRIAAQSTGAPVLLAHCGSDAPDAPSLMLSGHIDVVPPAGMTDPWSAEIRDGRLLGRGSTDMKGGAAAAIAAFCEASKKDLKGSLWLILSTDEETDVKGVKAALEEPGAPRPDLAIIAEPTELTIRNEHRGDAWVRVDFKGRSAHSSRPHLGVNAIEAAALFIVRARKRLPEMQKEGPGIGPQTTSIDMVSGGAAPNVVPASASVTIDFRYQGEECGRIQEERILRVVEELKKDPDFPPVEVSTTITGDWPALSSSLENPAAKQAIAAIEASLGHKVEVTPMSGWGEGGYMHAFGIPAFYFGPGEGKLAHTPQESSPVWHIEKAAEAIYRAVMAHCA